jgi:hypothetical protein
MGNSFCGEDRGFDSGKPPFPNRRTDGYLRRDAVSRAVGGHSEDQ